MSGTDDDVRSRVRKRLANTPANEVTAATVDEIVLEVTGVDTVVADLFREAEKTRFTIEGGTRGALNAGTSLNCFGLLAVVAAAAAWGGIFGRYESPGWAWMPPALAPVVAAAAVIVAVFSFGRPATRMASGSVTIGLLLLCVPGVVTMYASEVEPWEKWSILASIVVTGAASLWLRATRSLNTDRSRDLELALLHARREARTLLAEERPRFLPRLEHALQSTSADLDELEALWAVAAEGAAERGINDLDRAVGPVGASKLTAILDIPYDHHDRAGEQAEAAWEAKSRQP